MTKTIGNKNSVDSLTTSLYVRKMTQNLVDSKRLINLLADSKRIIIGVSGGADSMALLHQIIQYRNILDKDFKVLHVDHQINDASSSWAKLVSDYCAENQVECEVVKVDVSGYGNNLEQAARCARYAAFSAQECDTILTAHHANDQIETFFLKLLRASGTRGLSGMRVIGPCWFDKDKNVARPLLSVTRQDIEQYVDEHAIPYVTDPSNNDTTYDRNWIRHCLFPMIMDRNSIADINILKTMAIQDETSELITDLAEIDVERCTNSDGSLDWFKLKELQPYRLKNLFMHICNKMGSLDIKTKQIEMFVTGLRSATLDSKNEMSLDSVRVYKLGKRVFVENI